MSKECFNDTALRELLVEAHVPGQRVASASVVARDTPLIGPKHLKFWVRKEFELTIAFVK